MGIFVFLGIVSIVAGIICLVVRKNKKYTFEEISKECRETKGLLANITSLASMEAIKGSSLYDEVMRELETKHKAALNKIESYGLRKNVKEKLAQILAPYEAKKKYWEEAKERIELVRQEENKKMEFFFEFFSLIPKEFWSERAFKDASDLLNGSRADNLKEVFTLLENKYREERRDQEEEAFRQQQTEYQKKQTMYQQLQAMSASAAEYQRQQARAAESAAEYQRQQARAAASAAEYQRQQARAAERTAEAARRSAAANEENARKNR